MIVVVVDNDVDELLVVRFLPFHHFLFTCN